MTADSSHHSLQVSDSLQLFSKSGTVCSTGHHGRHRLQPGFYPLRVSEGRCQPLA